MGLAGGLVDNGGIAEGTLPPTVVDSASKSSPIVYPDAYGALGDGVTNDTTAVQAAINAVTTNGGTLTLRPGKNYLCGVLTPKSNVTIRGYGAKITSDGTPTNGLFLLSTGTLTGFKIMGVTFVPNGNEGIATACFRALTPAVCQDVEISDCSVTGWAGGPFYFGNPLRCRALRNTIINCCSNTGTNAINFVSFTNGTTAQECLAADNYVEGCATYGVAYVNTAQQGNQECRVIVTNNYCGGASSTGVGSGGIDIEFATASIGEGSKFVIQGNIVNFSGTGNGPTYGITVNGSAGTDGALVNRVVVSGNVVDSTSAGIQLNGSQIACTGNVVNSGLDVGILVGKSATGANQYVIVADNIVHSANTCTANGLIKLNQITDCKVHGNIVILDSGGASLNPCGISVTNQTATRLEISENTIIQPYRHGILAGGTDIDIRHNKIYNSGTTAQTFYGIFLNTVTGNIVRVRGNIILDDRAGSAVMNTGINSSSSPSANIQDNTIVGYTNVPITGTALIKAGNRYSTDVLNGRAVLVAGTVTVSTTEVVTGDSILLTPVVAGGTRGIVQVGTITNKTSFVINSVQPGTASTLQNADTSTVYWEIRH